ncbi:hypothetical protein ACFTE1_04605 [Salininema proteolyticum]|uniref:hypothetical protein n=1 Tax=Salininema proteolyticum TaxID=1607685 RepID=UPI00363843B0
MIGCQVATMCSSAPAALARASSVKPPSSASWSGVNSKWDWTAQAWSPMRKASLEPVGEAARTVASGGRTVSSSRRQAMTSRVRGAGPKRGVASGGVAFAEHAGFGGLGGFEDAAGDLAEQAGGGADGEQRGAVGDGGLEESGEFVGPVGASSAAEGDDGVVPAPGVGDEVPGVGAEDVEFESGGAEPFSGAADALVGVVLDDKSGS